MALTKDQIYQIGQMFQGIREYNPGLIAAYRQEYGSEYANAGPIKYDDATQGFSIDASYFPVDQPVKTTLARTRARVAPTVVTPQASAPVAPVVPEVPQFAQAYGGTIYNDLAAYTNAVLDDATAQYNDAVKKADRAYAQGVIDFQQRQDIINQNRDNINYNAQLALKQSGLNIKNLSQSKDTALSSQQGYFSNISPNAVQSQQGVYANKVLDSYQQGLEQQRTADEANQRATAQALASIDRYNQQLSQDRATAESSLADYKRGLSTTLQSQRDALLGLNVQNAAQVASTVEDFQNRLRGVASQYGAAFVPGQYSPVTANIQSPNISSNINALSGLTLNPSAISSPYANSAFGSVTNQTQGTGQNPLEQILYPN